MKHENIINIIGDIETTEHFARKSAANKAIKFLKEEYTKNLQEKTLLFSHERSNYLLFHS